jgi:hypothetical protein
MKAPLRELIEQQIGGRWSSEYKIPVFINMCQAALQEMKNKAEKG